MKQTVFIFGRTPHLSFLELQSFYPEAVRILDSVALVTKAVDASEMIHLLGGTVKIVELAASMPKLDTEVLLSELAAHAENGHLTFGISTYGKAHMETSVLAVFKKQLAARGISARYVETKEHETLSSVVVSKQQIKELVVIGTETGYLIGVTRAVQDFEDWNTRDFGRPEPDPKAGMLPPKVARMIVNVALAGNSLAPDHHPMLLDPFCGVGTILAEALLRGANTVGSDISETAVAHAKKNLEWLRHTYPAATPLYANVIVSDATHLSTHLTPGSIDAIATEPFMGDTVDSKDAAALTPERVKNILKGLEKLYIGALREWVNLLKPGARIVMAMPSYMVNGRVLRVKKVVDRCESLGYTLLTGPIEYGRPQAVVRREFYIFQKN